MTLYLYNTLTRKKEAFHPIDEKNVRMYVCGPTVYDFAHIGNARPAIVFDVLFRLLRHLYGESHVKYVRNITDVDDKINARALRDHPGMELNAAIRKVTETTANQYFADVKALGCLDPTVQPRATEHIKGMVDMISVLINKGHAYQANGEVLFDVGAMKDYGALSNRKLDEQQAGARVAVDAHKKNPGDFVLWKLSSADEPGWESPWGRGRPGWHIECSVMSKVELGEVFDIHGGGLDLIFPHHENEIAQSRCAHGTSVMANYWMHNGFLQVEGKKMSKSDGNFVTIQQMLNRWSNHSWPGDAVRWNMLKTNYREPIDWTYDSLDESHRFLWELYGAIESEKSLVLSETLLGALCDDLNFAKLSKELHELRKAKKFAEIRWCFTLLGFSCERASLTRNAWAPGATIDANFEGAASINFKGTANLKTLSREQVVRLIEDRLVARHQKNWAESDRLRDELSSMGIQIKDNKDGTTSWEVKR